MRLVTSEKGTSLLTNWRRAPDGARRRAGLPSPRLDVRRAPLPGTGTPSLPRTGTDAPPLPRSPALGCFYLRGVGREVKRAPRDRPCVVCVVCRSPPPPSDTNSFATNRQGCCWGRRLLLPGNRTEGQLKTLSNACAVVILAKVCVWTTAFTERWWIVFVF